MKTNKSRAAKKTTKKAVKKQIEQSLSDKFLDAVKGLGHNAELIADDIAKLSKSAARKLSKKFQEVKTAVGDKIEDISSSAKKEAPKKLKLAKKDASKLMKKVDKSVTKVVKKAVKKAKPVATSIKVEPLPSVKSEVTTAKAPVKRVTAKSRTTATNAVDTTTKAPSTVKKAVVKAAPKSPAKKVVPPTASNETAKK